MRRSSPLVVVCEVACATFLAFACSSASEGGGGLGTGGSQGTGFGSVGGNQGTGSTTGSGTCGNGIIDPGEACEPGNLNGANCATATSGAKSIGILGCLPNCSYDVSGCSSAGPGGGG